MLTERTIIKQINVVLGSDSVSVQWANQVLKDGEVIAENYSRKAYTRTMSEAFLAEVPNAQHYIAALGW